MIEMSRALQRNYVVSGSQTNDKSRQSTVTLLSTIRRVIYLFFRGAPGFHWLGFPYSPRPIPNDPHRYPKAGCPGIDGWVGVFISDSVSNKILV